MKRCDWYNAPRWGMSRACPVCAGAYTALLHNLVRVGGFVDIQMRCVSGESRKRLVFVVDDDEFARDSVATVLEQKGLAVQVCVDAAQALSRMRAGLIPDLIVLDLMMPGMDGWEFRLIQKEREQWADIRVIAVSGDKSAKAAAIDADAFLPKPLDERGLVQAVERLLQVSDRARTGDSRSELEHLQELGNMAAGLAEQMGQPIAALAQSLDVAQRKAVELARRLTSAEAFSMLGIRQLIQTAGRNAERVQATLQGVVAFSELAQQTLTTRRRVLIAHSERRLLTVLREALHEDYDVVTVSNGADARSALDDNGFDAFLCELGLPDIHGIDLFERLLVSKPEQACRTIFVLSGNHFGQRERAFFARHRPWQLRAPFQASDVREMLDAQWRALH